MKPEYLSGTDYKERMAKARTDLDADPQYKSLLALMPHLYELSAAGTWLQEQAIKEGADEQQATALAFCTRTGMCPAP